MNDIQIKHFIALAKIGSFSKAEDILNITKTALKKQIDTLESELGFSLFTRTPKGLQLTDCGSHFLKKANELYLEFNALVRECRSLALNQKKIRIGIYTLSNMMNWYSNIDANSRFSIEYIYLSGSNLTHERNLQLVKDKKIDFLEYEDNRLIFDEKLLFKKIDTDYLCCIMQANHALACNTAIRPEELAGYQLYCWTADSSATRTLYDYARKLNLNLQSIEYSENTVINTCRSGGIYILSHTLSGLFRTFKIIPVVPEIPYYRGLVYLPENEAVLKEMLKTAEPKSQRNFPDT
ncbi:MAG: LysR family transcriptional regulator [Eubacterium sp.]|nr:LysR family transcriptional regulator [Eubacterium sp.]